MKTPRLGLSLAFGIILHGCATPGPPANQLSNELLCKKYGLQRHNHFAQGINPRAEAEYRQEIDRRRLLSEREQANTDAPKPRVWIGMSQCAMYAAMGYPKRENRTATGGGIRIQHVFGDRDYIYTSNGTVTGWQD